MSLLGCFRHNILGLLVGFRNDLVGMGRSFRRQGPGLFPAVCQLGLAVIFRSHFHLSHFNFRQALHFIHKGLGLFFQLAGGRIRFAAEPCGVGIRIGTGEFSVIIRFAAGPRSIFVCLLTDFFRISVRFGFQPGNFCFRVSPQFVAESHYRFLLLVAGQFRFPGQHFRFLAAAFLHLVRRLLGNYQGALHSAFHALVIFQFGADPFNRIF